MVALADDFMRKHIISAAALGALTLLAATNAGANGVLITYAEDPGVQNSTLSNTSFISFDNLSTGKSSNVVWTDGATTVGTYDNAYIIPADKYGGSGGTGKYIVQSTSIGNPNQVPTTTLTLNTPSSYFGLWWSAGDSTNRLAFYNGGVLVADFTTATLLSVLPNDYKGNPTAPFLDQNSGEKYAFFNVFGDAGTTWDSIVFTNNGSSGFESDNHTTRVEAWGTLPGETGEAPGVAVMSVSGTTVSAPQSVAVASVPETSTWVMGFLAFGVVILVAGRRAVSA